MQFCAHCGTARADDARFCEACGSTLAFDGTAANEGECGRCASGLAPWWRYCARCGNETPVANLSRSKRVVIDDPTTAPTEVEAPRRQAERFEPVEAPRPSEHLLPGTFADVADRHGSHRRHQSEVVRGEIVDEPGDPELISRQRDPRPAAVIDDEVIELERLVEEHDWSPPLASSPGATPPAEPIQGGMPAAEVPPGEAADAAAAVIPEEPPARGAPRPEAADPRTIGAPEPQHAVENHVGGPETEGQGLIPRPTGRTIPVQRPGIDLARYRDPYVTSRLAQLVLLAVATLATTATIGLVALNNRIEDVARQVPEALDGAGDIADLLGVWVIRPLAATSVVGLVAVIAWTFVVYSNLVALGVKDLRIPRGGAVWAWAVPGYNLAMPKRLIDDAWRGADPEAWRDRDWRLRQGLMWTNTFWWSLMAALALSFVGWRLTGSTPETALDANGWAILSYGSLIVSCLAGVRMISATSARQNAAAEEALR